MNIEAMDTALIFASCVLLIMGTRAAIACAIGFVGTASVVYAWPDASGFQCFMTMSLVWCLSMLVVANYKNRAEGLLSICLGCISLLVGAAGVIDKFAPDSSESVNLLFTLYPYAMLLAQWIALMIVFYGGISSIRIHSDSVLGRLLSRRASFYLFGEK